MTQADKNATQSTPNNSNSNQSDCQADAQKTQSQLVDELLEVITLEKLEENIYRGASRNFVGKRVFGGQVLAQALMAASLTTDRPCHSMHAYFLRGGDIRAPIVYQVECLRDGRSILSRRVQAVQFGKVLFTAIASFAHFEGGLEFQTEPPNVNHHSELLKIEEAMQNVKEFIPEHLHKRIMRKRHVEIKPTKTHNRLHRTPADPHQAAWLRAHDIDNKISKDIKTQQALLAFASDFMLLDTSLLPHGLSFWTTSSLQMATIDHSIHFHGTFDLTDWLLHDMRCDVTAHARGLNRGQIWQDGKLVASTQQEGLIRLREDDVQL